MSQEMDISWQVLRRIVQDWAGSSAELDEVKPLDGGCINTTLALTLTDGGKAVLKISPHRVNRAYAEEAFQLELLRDAGLPVPEVYAFSAGSLDNPHSYLLMQFVEGIDFNAARRTCSPEEFDGLQVELAELLLRLHARTGEKFGRLTADASSAQWDKWPPFYRHVFDPVWAEAEKHPALPTKCRKQIGKVHEKLERVIAHDDVPRLVHWDVWATNLLAAPNGDGRWHVTAVLDPMCKYAHAEAEIAYMELFKTATPAFLKAYQQGRKLSPDYHRLRKPVYQMYSLMNHVVGFGAEYVRPLLAAVERVAQVV